MLFRKFTGVMPAALAAMVCACSGGGSKTATSPADTDTLAVSDATIDNYDIAMAVSSITDAIEVGEPLDTSEYNFEGILTDGRGTPLYTDVQGSPGKWRIDVVSENHARIRNIYLGDLVPDSLTKYIVSSLALSGAHRLESAAAPDDPGCIGDYPVYSYNFGNSVITFTTKSVMTSDGEEGPLFCITIGSRQGRKT